MSLALSQPSLSLPGAPSNRVLVLCVLGSLVLHAAVLLLFPVMRQESIETQGAVKVLTARIASVATPAPPAPVVPEPERRPEPPPAGKPPPAPPPPQAVRPPPKPVAEPPRPVLTQPEPAPSAPVAPPPPVAAPTPVPPPAPAAPPAPLPPLASAPPSVPPPAVAPPGGPAAAPQASAAATPKPPALSGEEAGSLEQYRMSLIVAARRYKRYPAVAMEKGWQGRVEVRLLIGPDGMTRSAVIQRSSGHEILDATALDMVRKAKPLTQIPAALRGKDFVVDVPVIFDLSQG